MTSKIYKIGKKIIPDNFKKKALNAYFKINNLVKYGTTDFFNFIEFQSITTCNRSCSFCPISKAPLKRHLMSLELVKKLAIELKEIDYRGWVSPHLYGEPLLDRRLVEITEILHEYVPKSKIVIYSNGDFLKVEKFRELIKAGADLFIISQYDKDMHKTMKKLFDTITDDEKKLINYKIMNEDSPLSNRGGIINPENLVLDDCPVNSVFIDSKGKVVICSNDYFSTAVFGDLNKEKLVDIWNKESYVNIRKKLKKDEYIKGVCRRCKGDLSKK